MCHSKRNHFDDLVTFIQSPYKVKCQRPLTVVHGTPVTLRVHQLNRQCLCLRFFSADVSVWMWLCDEIAAAYYVTNAAITGMATQPLGLQLSAVFAIVALTSFLISGGYSLEHKCL